MPAVDDTISTELRDRVLGRLGLARLPRRDIEGLRELYGAWHAGVPFDNLRKMIAMRSAQEGALPGGHAEDFLEAWLAHGTGGTCWPRVNALTALLQACGFEARRVAASMRDLGLLNHGSVKVSIGGQDWLADLVSAPVPLTDEVTVHVDPLSALEVEPVDGTHLLWWDVTPGADYLPCRVMVDPVDHAFFLQAYEQSRAASPFNHRLYVQLSRRGRLVSLIGRQRFTRTAAGTGQVELSREELLGTLESQIGISRAFLDAWVACGALEASFEPSSGNKPPPVTGLPPSRRRRG